MKKMKKKPSNTTEVSTVKQKKQWITPEMTDFDIKSGPTPDLSESTLFNVS